MKPRNKSKTSLFTVLATLFCFLLPSASANSAEWVLKMNNANGCVVQKAGEPTPGNIYYEERERFSNVAQACRGAHNLTDFTSSSNRRCHHFDEATVVRCNDAGVTGLPGT